MRQENFEGKSWYFPLLLIHKLFRYQKLSETQHRRVPLRNVSVLWDKKFTTENRDIPGINHALKGSPTKFFGTVRQTIFDWKSWYSPLFIHKLFRYPKFSETQHRRVPLRNVSVLRDKKSSTKNCDNTLLSIKFLHTRSWWHPKRSPY